MKDVGERELPPHAPEQPPLPAADRAPAKDDDGGEDDEDDNDDGHVQSTVSSPSIAERGDGRCRRPSLVSLLATLKLRDTARFSTICIHAGQVPDPSTGAIITPIYQTSTYVQEALGKHKGYEYARTQNPTRSAFEANIAAIENGKAAFGFASGMAATGAVMTLLESGDHVVVTDNTYGGTYRLFERVLRKSSARLHLRRHVADRRHRGGDRSEDEDALPRDADQPDAAPDGSGGGVRGGAQAERRGRGGQHVRQPVRAAADRLRRRHGRPQHDEVPERPQRQRRRRGRRHARGPHRVAAVHPERRGGDHRADGRLARAARDQDAADPDGAAQRQRDGAGRIPGLASEGDAGALPRAPLPSAARAGEDADARASAGSSRLRSARSSTRGRS